MEFLRPGAAVDPPVKALFFWGAFLWILLVSVASGHGGAYVQARCSQQPDERILLQVTVDYGLHPYLRDPEAARQAVQEALLLITKEGPVSLGEVTTASLSFEGTPAADLPLPPDPLEEGKPHRLAVARYSWKPAEGPLQFQVPAIFAHDVLFWMEAGFGSDGGHSHAPGPVQWQILLPGEKTPVLPAPGPKVPETQAPQEVPAPKGRNAFPTMAWIWSLVGAFLAGVALCVAWPRIRDFEKDRQHSDRE